MAWVPLSPAYVLVAAEEKGPKLPGLDTLACLPWSWLTAVIFVSRLF